MNTIPTIEQIKALDGLMFATLAPAETAVLDFYRSQGRKFDVSICIANEISGDDLAEAGSQKMADELLKRSDSRVSVTVGAGAEMRWKRATQVG